MIELLFSMVNVAHPGSMATELGARPSDKPAKRDADNRQFMGCVDDFCSETAT
jgi:hypothetical protein